MLRSGVVINPSDLYNYTIQELSAIVDGFNEQQKRQAVFFGTVASAIYNVNRKKSSKFLKWSDIFPMESNSNRNENMTAEEISAMLHGMFGGKRKG